MKRRLEDRDRGYGYGGVEPNCAVGNTTRRFGYFWTLDEQIGISANLTGYPGVTQPYGTMCRISEKIAVRGPRRTFFNICAEVGSSGCPLCLRDSSWCGGHCVTATASRALSGTNAGVAIREDVFNVFGYFNGQQK